jgi:hypothetical protein
MNCMPVLIKSKNRIEKKSAVVLFFLRDSILRFPCFPHFQCIIYRWVMIAPYMDQQRDVEKIKLCF